MTFEQYRLQELHRSGQLLPVIPGVLYFAIVAERPPPSLLVLSEATREEKEEEDRGGCPSPLCASSSSSNFLFSSKEMRRVYAGLASLLLHPDDPPPPSLSSSREDSDGTASSGRPEDCSTGKEGNGRGRGRRGPTWGFVGPESEEESCLGQKEKPNRCSPYRTSANAAAAAAAPRPPPPTSTSTASHARRSSCSSFQTCSSSLLSSSPCSKFAFERRRKLWMAPPPPQQQPLEEGEKDRGGREEGGVPLFLAQLGLLSPISIQEAMRAEEEEQERKRKEHEVMTGMKTPRGSSSSLPRPPQPRSNGGSCALTSEGFYFSISNDPAFRYTNCFEDFGPLNISCIILFARRLSRLLHYTNGWEWGRAGSGGGATHLGGKYPNSRTCSRRRDMAELAVAEIEGVEPIQGERHAKHTSSTPPSSTNPYNFWNEAHLEWSSLYSHHHHYHCQPPSPPCQKRKEEKNKWGRKEAAGEGGRRGGGRRRNGDPRNHRDHPPHHPPHRLWRGVNERGRHCYTHVDTGKEEEEEEGEDMKEEDGLSSCSFISSPPPSLPPPQLQPSPHREGYGYFFELLHRFHPSPPLSEERMMEEAREKKNGEENEEERRCGRHGWWGRGGGGGIRSRSTAGPGTNMRIPSSSTLSSSSSSSPDNKNNEEEREWWGCHAGRGCPPHGYTSTSSVSTGSFHPRSTHIPVIFTCGMNLKEMTNAVCLLGCFCVTVLRWSPWQFHHLLFSSHATPVLSALPPSFALPSNDRNPPPPLPSPPPSSSSSLADGEDSAEEKGKDNNDHLHEENDEEKTRARKGFSSTVEDKRIKMKNVSVVWKEAITPECVPASMTTKVKLKGNGEGGGCLTYPSIPREEVDEGGVVASPPVAGVSPPPPSSFVSSSPSSSPLSLPSTILPPPPSSCSSSSSSSSSPSFWQSFSSCVDPGAGGGVGGNFSSSFSSCAGGFRLYCHPASYRDGSTSISRYPLHLIDVLLSVDRAVRLRWLQVLYFSISDYQTGMYSPLPYTWVIPGRVLAVHSPDDDSHSPSRSAEVCAEVLQRLGISLLIRLNGSTSATTSATLVKSRKMCLYKKKVQTEKEAEGEEVEERRDGPVHGATPLLQRGISIKAFPFPDGGVPRDHLLLRFLRTLKSVLGEPPIPFSDSPSSLSSFSSPLFVPPARRQVRMRERKKAKEGTHDNPSSCCPLSSPTEAVAIHCHRGLGRTGTMIGALLILYYYFSAREAIAWLRVCRPGSVTGVQQVYLEELERRIHGVSYEGHHYRPPTTVNHNHHHNHDDDKKEERRSGGPACVTQQPPQPQGEESREMVLRPTYSPGKAAPPAHSSSASWGSLIHAVKQEKEEEEAEWGRRWARHPHHTRPLHRYYYYCCCPPRFPHPSDASIFDGPSLQRVLEEEEEKERKEYIGRSSHHHKHNEKKEQKYCFTSILVPPCAASVRTGGGGEESADGNEGDEEGEEGQATLPYPPSPPPFPSTTPTLQHAKVASHASPPTHPEDDHAAAAAVVKNVPASQVSCDALLLFPFSSAVPLPPPPPPPAGEVATKEKGGEGSHHCYSSFCHRVTPLTNAPPPPGLTSHTVKEVEKRGKEKVVVVGGGRGRGGSGNEALFHRVEKNHPKWSCCSSYLLADSLQVAPDAPHVPSSSSSTSTSTLLPSSASSTTSSPSSSFPAAASASATAVVISSASLPPPPVVEDRSRANSMEMERPSNATIAMNNIPLRKSRTSSSCASARCGPRDTEEKENRDDAQLMRHASQKRKITKEMEAEEKREDSTENKRLEKDAVTDRISADSTAFLIEEQNHKNKSTTTTANAGGYTANISGTIRSNTIPNATRRDTIRLSPARSCSSSSSTSSLSPLAVMMKRPQSTPMCTHPMLKRRSPDHQGSRRREGVEEEALRRRGGNRKAKGPAAAVASPILPTSPTSTVPPRPMTASRIGNQREWRKPSSLLVPLSQPSLPSPHRHPRPHRHPAPPPAPPSSIRISGACACRAHRVISSSSSSSSKSSAYDDDDEGGGGGRPPRLPSSSPCTMSTSATEAMLPQSLSAALEEWRREPGWGGSSFTTNRIRTCRRVMEWKHKQ